MDPITLGIIGFAGLVLWKKRKQVQPGGIGERNQELTRVLSGVTPDPVPLVTARLPTSEDLPPDIGIEQFLTSVEQYPGSIAPLSPEGQFPCPPRPVRIVE